MKLKLTLDKSWKKYLGDELKKEYMVELLSFLEEEKIKGKII